MNFLVQNTLGRRLIENDPTSPLLEELPLLVDPPMQRGPSLELDEVRCLDPACGSGHFLLGCYDLLERAWEHVGVPPADSAPKIVSSLWGVDIDARCAQVASAAIVLRARRHCRDHDLPRPNIITARGLPMGSAALPAEMELTAGQRRLIDRISDVLAEASSLGTLLKADEAFDEEIRHGVFGGRPRTLEVTDEAADVTERQLLSHLQSIADETSSSVFERLLAVEADDALRFVHAVRQRYDIVLMNPPYGLSIPSAERYLKSAFPDGWTDLYVAFFYRAHELLRDSGYLGALTSSRYFATRKQRSLRQFMIRESRPLSIIDLGPGVLHGAAVNTAMTVMAKRRATGRTFYVDLTTTSSDKRDLALGRALENSTTKLDLADFSTVDGCPFAFHASGNIDAWMAEARLEPGLAMVRKGNCTFDDFRFVRCRWEVDPRHVGDSWIAYEKGGTYRPYFAPAHLVLDWKGNGRRLREVGERRGILPQILQCSSHWYKPGLSFPRVNKGLGARVMPAGEIFSDRSNVVFPNADIDPLVLLGILNSWSIAALLESFGRSRFVENGAVKALPISVDHVEELRAVLPDPVRAMVGLFADDDSRDEGSALFCSPFVGGASPGSFVREASSRRAAAAALQNEIDVTVQEVLSVTQGAAPGIESQSKLVASALLESSDADKEWARRTVSYLFGVAAGRWDGRLGRAEPSRFAFGDPFEALPKCPPGMLVGPDGLPATEPLAGYSLELPTHRLLIDEPGHRWDVETAILAAAGFVLDESVSTVAEALGLLGRNTIRDYLRKQFFKDHLSRYSKSRRKAPIYWPLTVPSKNWGVWVYAPMLTRETLYAVASEAGRRERLAVEAIARLQREQQEGGAGRPPRKVAEELDAEERLAEELRRFRTEAERVAGLGWEPDLDDGIILCAGPLADLFPSWPDAKTARTELRKGKFEWSAVAAWADQL